ncbi:MAG: biotin/lipoyl-binding protein, partial [Paludibacteraceae bacterium]|nr:biotin/lipoyl-binding protein [Paludibacteraceae bacterium]
MNIKQKKTVYNIIVCTLLIISLGWVVSRFVHFGNVEFTDNAQAKQLIVPVNSRVQGFIKEIRFEEYQEVKKGDTLAIIEDTEFRFRLAQAEADFERATSGKNAMHKTINMTESNISVSDAAIEESRIRMDNAEREFNRYKNLHAQDAVTKQQFDAVQTNYE